MFQYTPHFAVLAFGQRHFQPAIAAGAAFEIGVDLAVFYAIDLDTVDQFFKLFLRYIAKQRAR